MRILACAIFGSTLIACAAPASEESAPFALHPGTIAPVSAARSSECVALRDGREGAHAATWILRFDLKTGAVKDGPKLSAPLEGVALGMRDHALFACGARVDLHTGAVTRLRDDCAALTAGEEGVWLGDASATRLFARADFAGPSLRDVPAQRDLLGAHGDRLLVAGTGPAGAAALVDARTGASLGAIEVAVEEGEYWTPRGADLTADGKLVVLRVASLATHAIVADPSGARAKTIELPPQVHGVVCDGAFSE
jgi:hypothetical protein